VRSNIWYSFRRHNIEIPYPIQVQYEREEAPARRLVAVVGLLACALYAIGVILPSIAALVIPRCWA